jgi:hypothetical protein
MMLSEACTQSSAQSISAAHINDAAPARRFRR